MGKEIVGHPCGGRGSAIDCAFGAGARPQCDAVLQPEHALGHRARVYPGTRRSVFFHTGGDRLLYEGDLCSLRLAPGARCEGNDGGSYEKVVALVAGALKFRGTVDAIVGFASPTAQARSLAVLPMFPPVAFTRTLIDGAQKCLHGGRRVRLPAESRPGQKSSRCRP